MNLDFDLQNITSTEFGVGIDSAAGQQFFEVPADGDVQGALNEMVADTWSAMEAMSPSPSKYEPSEKYGATEYLYVPVTDDLAAPLMQLHDAVNLPTNAKALDDPTDVFCYFARLADAKSRHVTAVRRASQFKGVLKSRLIQLTTNALKLVKDKTFKLDSDFDLLIDSKNLHIFRPAAFEFAGKLQAAILDAVPTNVTLIQKELNFVEFSTIQTYAEKHPRAARYLASIKAQGEMKSIDKAALKRLCKRTEVDITISNGKIVVDDHNVMGFLEVLDRRRYELELVKGKPERFRAASRSRL
jgi:Domain of unknown function (DUF4868)